MMALHIFLSYETTDAAFAIQLMTYLRETGAEVITDSIGLEDSAFEQFLSEQLPQCQYLIVVQTPAALQSLRVRSVVDSALKLVQAGQMTDVLRVIAPDLDGVKAQAVPLRWAGTPEFDASQDYARVLSRLCLLLEHNNTKTNSTFPQPISSMPAFNSFEPQRIENTMPFYDQAYAQRATEKDRPRRPIRHTSGRLRWYFIILSLITVVILASVLTFIYLRTSAQTTKPTLTPPHSSVLSGYYYVQNRYTSNVLDDANWSTNNGTGIIQWQKVNGQANQEWTFISVNSGYYYIQNRTSGKVLDAALAPTAKKPPAGSPKTQKSTVSDQAKPSTTAGIQIIQWEKANGHADQEWKLTPTDNGYYYIQNRNSGQVLDVNAGSIDNGALIVQWHQKAGDASLNQQWAIKQA